MAKSKTRHATNVTGSDACKPADTFMEYQKLSLDASEFATLWIAKRFRMPILTARMIAALASLGGGA